MDRFALPQNVIWSYKRTSRILFSWFKLYYLCSTIYIVLPEGWSGLKNCSNIYYQVTLIVIILFSILIVAYNYNFHLNTYKTKFGSHVYRNLLSSIFFCHIIIITQIDFSKMKFQPINLLKVHYYTIVS